MEDRHTVKRSNCRKAVKELKRWDYMSREDFLLEWGEAVLNHLQERQSVFVGIGRGNIEYVSCLDKGLKEYGVQ